MTSLAIAEHDNAQLKGATFNTVAAALVRGGDVHMLAAELFDAVPALTALL
jgi:electron transfer flavoprotein alpha subunit